MSGKSIKTGVTSYGDEETMAPNDGKSRKVPDTGEYQGPCSLCRLSLQKGVRISALVGLCIALAIMGLGLSFILANRSKEAKFLAEPWTTDRAFYLLGNVLACKGVYQTVNYLFLMLGLYVKSRVIIGMWAGLEIFGNFSHFVGGVIVAVETHHLLLPIITFVLVPIDIYIMLVAISYSRELSLAYQELPVLKMPGYIEELKEEKDAPASASSSGTKPPSFSAPAPERKSDPGAAAEAEAEAPAPASGGGVFAVCAVPEKPNLPPPKKKEAK